MFPALKRPRGLIKVTLESFNVGLNFFKASAKELAVLLVAPGLNTLGVPFLKEVLVAPTILLFTLSTVQILRLGIEVLASSLLASLEGLSMFTVESLTSSPDFTDMDEPTGLLSSLPPSPTLGKADCKLEKEAFSTSCAVLPVDVVSFAPSAFLESVAQPLGDALGSAGMIGVFCALALEDLFPPDALGPVPDSSFLSSLVPCILNEEETDRPVEATCRSISLTMFSIGCMGAWEINTSDWLVEGVTGSDSCVSSSRAVASAEGFEATSRVLLFPFVDLGGQGWLGSVSTVQGTGGVKIGNRCPARGTNGGLFGVAVAGRRGGVIAVNSMVARVGDGEMLPAMLLTGTDGVARGVVVDERVGGRGDS